MSLDKDKRLSPEVDLDKILFCYCLIFKDGPLTEVFIRDIFLYKPA